MYRVLSLAFTFTALTATSEATTVEPMSLDDMARRASFIFIGHARAARADWSPDHTRIYTYVTFEVERYLKGGAGEREVTLRFMGGQVGAYVILVPGSPDFASGEEVLLFCAGSHARVPTVLGLSVGKFSITVDDAGERILTQDLTGIDVPGYRSDARTPDTPVTRYRLSEVEARIKRALTQ